MGDTTATATATALAMHTVRRARSWAWRAGGVGVLALMTSAVGAQQSTATDTRFPDVLSATVRSSAADHFDFDVTVSSPYDTPRRYADGFRVMRLSGEVLGERTLWHDHQAEQPFTRDLYGVKIPVGVRTVRIQARDQKHGYGGRSIEVPLPGRP